MAELAPIVTVRRLKLPTQASIGTLRVFIFEHPFAPTNKTPDTEFSTTIVNLSPGYIYKHLSLGQLRAIYAYELQVRPRSVNDPVTRSRKDHQVAGRDDLAAAAHQPRRGARRVSHRHGSVGRRQDHAHEHPRHARRPMDRRVLLRRRSRPQDEPQAALRAQQEEHRVRLPELSPA